MELTLEIIGLIALIAIIIFSVVAIISFTNINRLVREASIAVDRINNDLRIVKDKVIDNLDDLKETQAKANKALDDIEDIKKQSIISMKNFDNLSEEIQKTASTADGRINDTFDMLKPIEALIATIYTKFMPPINQTANVMTAVSRAVSVFTEKLSSRKKNK